MPKTDPTFEQLIDAARGRDPYIARKSYAPFTIAVYDDPAWAEKRAVELGADVRHALLRPGPKNVAATFSVILGDDPSVPSDPIPLAEFLSGRASIRR